MNKVVDLFPTTILHHTIEEETFKPFDKEIQEFLENPNWTRNGGGGNSHSEDLELLDKTPKLGAYLNRVITTFLKDELYLDFVDFWFTESWINQNKTGEFHHKHAHPNSLYSGVLFLTESPEEYHGNLQFHRPQRELFAPVRQDENSHPRAWSYAFFSPKKGLLIVFPSNLQHEVSPNLSPKTRMTLSFNLMVSPLGRRSDKTFFASGI